jgi:hypothetical protein
MMDIHRYLYILQQRNRFSYTILIFLRNETHEKGGREEREGQKQLLASNAYSPKYIYCTVFSCGLQAYYAFTTEVLRLVHKQSTQIYKS